MLCPLLSILLASNCADSLNMGVTINPRQKPISYHNIQEKHKAVYSSFCNLCSNHLLLADPIVLLGLGLLSTFLSAKTIFSLYPIDRKATDGMINSL